MESLLGSALQNQALADQAPDGARLSPWAGSLRLGDLSGPSLAHQTAEPVAPYSANPAPDRPAGRAGPCSTSVSLTELLQAPVGQRSYSPPPAGSFRGLSR
jgi:hypothetical protein